LTALTSWLTSKLTSQLVLMRRASCHLLALALAASGCRQPTSQPPIDVAPDDAASLAVGQVATIRGSGTRFRIEAINDSRCPADVRCVWAGDAVVVVTASGAGATRTDTLHTGLEPRGASYGDYRLLLVDVQPVSRSTDGGTAKRATIRVSRR
jgi:hypothetical protein